jgi:hypothetical protein
LWSLWQADLEASPGLMLREDCHPCGTAWMLGPRGKEGGSTTPPSWLELGLLELMLSGLELDCATAEAADN